MGAQDVPGVWEPGLLGFSAACEARVLFLPSTGQDGLGAWWGRACGVAVTAAERGSQQG